MISSERSVGQYSPALEAPVSGPKRPDALDGAGPQGHTSVMVDLSSPRSPQIRQFTLLQRWTLLTSSVGRIDIIGTTDSRSSLGSHLEVVAVVLGRRSKLYTEFGVHYGNFPSVRVNLRRKNPFPGVSQASTFTQFSAEHGLCSGVVVVCHPDDTTQCTAQLSYSVDGPKLAMEMVSAPAGKTKAVVKFGWEKTAGSPLSPYSHLSVPIFTQHVSAMRLYTRLALDSREVGIAFGNSSRLNIGAHLDSMGLGLMLRVRHHLFSMSVPIKFADSVTAPAVLLSIVAPLTALAVWKLHFSSTASQERLDERKNILLRKAADLQKRHDLAMNQREAMRSEAAEIRASERAQQGLVIVRAEYRVVGMSEDSIERSKRRGPLFASTVDVGVALQFWVSDSGLTLPAQSKAGMLGFYAPFDGGKKLPRQLFVEYLYAGEMYRCTIGDMEPLHLPDIERHQHITESEDISLP